MKLIFYREKVLGVRTFLIQTTDSMISNEFCFHLIKAIEFNNWFYNEKVYDYVLAEKALKGTYVPVGSLEFVYDYLKLEYGIEQERILPINIPDALMELKFLKREVQVRGKGDIELNGPKFIKSAAAYKSFTEIVNKVKDIPDGTYLVSDLIEINSEWRAFICNGELVGIQHYAGDFRIFPDVSFVEEMVSLYTDGPRSYTLDLGINEEGNFLIESHPFVSCGLYGFADYKRLPLMFIQGFDFMRQGAETVNI